MMQTSSAQIVDMPVPKCLEDIVEVMMDIPQERIAERMFETHHGGNRGSCADHRRMHGRANREHAFYPAAEDEHVDRIVEQIVDIPASQIREEIVGGVKIIPQELVLLHTKSTS